MRRARSAPGSSAAPHDEQLAEDPVATHHPIKSDPPMSPDPLIADTELTREAPGIARTESYEEGPRGSILFAGHWQEPELASQEPVRDAVSVVEQARVEIEAYARSHAADSHRGERPGKAARTNHAHCQVNRPAVLRGSKPWGQGQDCCRAESRDPSKQV